MNIDIIEIWDGTSFEIGDVTVHIIMHVSVYQEDNQTSNIYIYK